MPGGSSRAAGGLAWRSVPAPAARRVALGHAPDDLFVPPIGAHQPVTIRGNAHVGLGVGPGTNQIGLTQHLDHRAVLVLQPQKGALAAADSFAPLLTGPKPPGLDALGERRVVPRVKELDLRSSVIRDRHALEELSLVALERQSG